MKLAWSNRARQELEHLKACGEEGAQRSRGALRDRLSVTSQAKLEVAVPQDTRFRGHEDVVVQDLQVSVAVTRYRRERRATATGERIMAHCDPESSAVLALSCAASSPLLAFRARSPASG